MLKLRNLQAHHSVLRS